MGGNFSISASIVTYNNGQGAVDTVKNILNETRKIPLKLYCIDNNSADNTAELLENQEGIILIKNPYNMGFGKGHNRVLNENLGKYHFIINPDISVCGDVLSDIAWFLEKNPDIVLLRPEILNEDGSVQPLPLKKPTFKRLYLGRIFQKIRAEYTTCDKTEIDFCSGCFMCIRSDVFKIMGGFDPRYFMYLEDADLTLRAKEYGKTVIARQFSVTHKWERGSAKSLKLLFCHFISAIKFLSRNKK